MPAAAQASSVCRVCKARKKKCDKVLPSCGYCTNKGLQCNYQQAELISNERKPPTEQYLKPVFTYLPQLPLQDPLSSTELALCHQAQNLITATGQYLDEVSVCYFQGVHSFVPMISRSRFHDQLLSYGASPRADFAMLLLSMSLLTCSPAPADSPGIESFSYYLSVKSLLCQAQTLCRPSLDLIQAGVLLAVFEYACGEPEQALMTIGVYARMAYAAGLKRPTSLPDNIATDTPSHIEAEQHDTWWAISICERLFLCEATNTAQPLLSPISDSDHFKPDHITSSASADPLISGFRNAAVAACLLDRAIQIRSDGKQDEINSLDKELQLFLSEMMHQFPIGSQRNCGAIAIAIR
ncbi:hypothetical protein BJY04DRAFT_222775 [Aspergillus karnatakaensis]|uniref:Zn(II)2Cys6 transcription factor n=1 Tax=Aspergillus karnatakaensis TaxID=1810916 RepID=UPI003CCD5E4D